MSDTKPLILLLGNYRPSLTLARTFKRRGFEVAVGTHGCERLCQYSNAVSFMWAHSSLENGVKALAQELKTFQAQNPNLKAIIPVSEEYVRIIAEHEIAFEELVPMVTMRSSLVRQCLDKEFLLNLSRTANVPTAPFAFVNGLDAAISAGEGNVGYPMILRPMDSTKRINGNKAISIEDSEALANCFAQNQLQNDDLIIQRKFEGKRHNVYFGAVDGDAVRLLHALIERTDKFDDTGLAVDGVTLSAEHELVEQTRKLLKELNYEGIGCAQFLVNQQTGETSFLEINPRIAGNHAVPEHAGLDLGWFNFARVINDADDRTEIIGKAGLRYCWTSGDLDGAKIALLKKEINLPQFVGWILKALSTASRSRLHMVFDRRDPVPALRALWKLVPRIARWKPPKTVNQNSTSRGDIQKETV